MENRTFLGMTIEGETYKHHASNVKQLNQEEVSQLIHDVLRLPGVLGLAWSQYTPYFNDGDTCVFGASDPYISLEGLTPESYMDYGWMEDDFEQHGRTWVYPYSEQFETAIGNDERIYSGSYSNRTWEYKVALENQPNPTLFKAFMELNDAMNSGSCDNSLLELFGDHATVIIDKKAGKVFIETYEHD